MADWRWNLLNALGPGGYPGFLMSDWLRLLRDNRFSVSPSHLIRATSASAGVVANSAIACCERMRFGAEVEKTEVRSPLFVLGHWRSGTTHLQKLLGMDERFAFPNLYQVSWPHTFLSTEAASTRLTRAFLPGTRPFDNVRQSWEMPNEDELAIATLTQRSPYVGGLFPQRCDHYDRYLTFRDVPSHEIDEWRSGFLHFLKKLTWKYQKPLVLKSPPHTARIRLLLDVFPDARFVHIHRNPYTVFQSTLHMVRRTFRLTQLQKSDSVNLEARTLRVYREMHDSFFEERNLIPPDQFHELSFADLEQDPIGHVRRIYEAISDCRTSPRRRLDSRITWIRWRAIERTSSPNFRQSFAVGSILSGCVVLTNGNTRQQANAMANEPQNDQWEPGLYDGKHSFVWKLGASVIELLAPQPGERILDLGCGTGQLTAQIAETKATVVGLDNSPAMIDEARRLYPDVEFQLGDAHDFEFDEPFDGVFSNAALHWIKEPSKVVECISRSLKANGRLAVEFGGQGNVRYLTQAIETASRSFLGHLLPNSWYFPSIAEFGSVLEQHELEVTQAAMIARPTPLEGDDGLRNWVRMFGQHWLKQIPTENHAAFFEQVEEIARPNRFRDSVWYADYRRIRVVAGKLLSKQLEGNVTL